MVMLRVDNVLAMRMTMLLAPTLSTCVGLAMWLKLLLYCKWLQGYAIKDDRRARLAHPLFASASQGEANGESWGWLAKYFAHPASPSNKLLGLTTYALPLLRTRHALQAKPS